MIRGLSAYDLFVFDFGYRPASPSWMTLFTSMFLHGGLLHLFGNMLFLWIYGDNVEHRLGAVPFVAAYLLTGASATLFHAAFASSSPLPLVGASGAISGVLGFYFVWFPKNRIRVLIWIVIIVRIVFLPARVVLGIYIVMSNILPFLAEGGGSGGVAYGAHIGGFLAGAAIAFFLDLREMTAQPREYRGHAPRPADSAAPGEAIERALRAGDYERAAEIYFEVPRSRSRGLLSPESSLALGNWLGGHGHARAALTVFQRHLRDHPTGPGLAEAHAAAGLLQLHAFGEPTAAYQHLVESLDYEPPRALEARVRQALAEIAAVQKYPVRGRR